MAGRCIRCEKDIEDISLLCSECAEERFRNNLFWVIISPVIGSPVIDRYKKDSEPTLTIGERPGDEMIYQEGLKTLEEVEEIEKNFDRESKKDALNRLNTILAELGVVKELDFDKYLFSRDDVKIFSEIFYLLEDKDSTVEDEDRVPNLYLRMANVFFYAMKQADTSAFPPELRNKLKSDFTDEAERYYNKAIEFSEDDHFPFYNLGKLLYRIGRYEEAKKKFERALNLQKGDYDLKIEMVKTLQKLEKLDDVEDHLDKLVEMYPEKPEVWYLYGEQSKLRNRWGGAVQFFNQALSKDEDHLPSLLGKGKVLLENNNYRKADKIFDRYIKLKEDNPEVWLGKARALDSLSKWGGALQCINECIAFDSQIEEAWTLKGDILKSQKYYEEAIESYENALKLNPDSEKAKRSIEDCRNKI